MGKRTYFQQTALPQLAITVEQNIDTTSIGCHEENSDVAAHFVNDLKLEDDTRLNKIAFTDSKMNATPDVSPLCQAVLLAKA